MEHRFNRISDIKTDRNIYFIIDLRELKIVKVFKDFSYFEKIKSEEDAYYFVCYGLSIYRGNLCYIGTTGTKVIGFKSFATQVLNMIKSKYTEHIEWKPNVGIEINKILSKNKN